MIGIELQCYVTNDEDAVERFRILNIPIPDESVRTIPLTFYNIDNVEPCESGCLVRSGGGEYSVAESYDSVNKKVRQLLASKWN